MQQKNIYITPLLQTLDIEDSDTYLSDDLTLFKDILSENNFVKKMNLFFKLKTVVYTKYHKQDNILFNILNFDDVALSDFWQNGTTTNSILTNDSDKKYLLNILTNIYKIILLFPNHTKLSITNDMIDAIKVKVNNIMLNKTKNVNYLKGDYDTDRLAYLTHDDLLFKYIASIDSYYYIYDKLKIDDVQFQLLLELYDYIDNITNSVTSTDKHKHMTNFFEAKTHNIKKTITKKYNINIDDINNEIKNQITNEDLSS